MQISFQYKVDTKVSKSITHTFKNNHNNGDIAHFQYKEYIDPFTAMQALNTFKQMKMQSPCTFTN